MGVGGRREEGVQRVHRVLRKPRKEAEGVAQMRGKDEQCGVARKEVSKPAKIGRPLRYGAGVSRHYGSGTNGRLTEIWMRTDGGRFNPACVRANAAHMMVLAGVLERALLSPHGTALES